LFALGDFANPSKYWPKQMITHLLVHTNLFHLVTNVAAIGIASVYERRVGTKRFLAILVVSCMSSIPSVLFCRENITVCGISGGIFGLAAVYFTDHENLTVKEMIRRE
jgi:membrane associated rhomboid family serine protease